MFRGARGRPSFAVIAPAPGNAISGTITPDATPAADVHLEVAVAGTIAPDATPAAALYVEVSLSGTITPDAALTGNITDGAIEMPIYQFKAYDMLSTDDSDWAVNAAARLAVDTNDSGAYVRLFDDGGTTAQEGVGFMFEVPAAATGLKIRIWVRAETTPGGSVAAYWNFYERGVSDNGVRSSWSSAIQMTAASFSTNENQRKVETDDTLSNWGLTAGDKHDIQITRDTPDASDTLSGDAAVEMIVFEFY